ncbi:Diguanylate cyclase DosC [Novipirellula artificiosorum]|uniref:diguanylate cyclase n=2 Tax=Novipirellula artificiosorum TaxID=2528016 RepID=A0A5C6DWR8_9BACT|nr:Diguanylate cyclase DosC [Novipirellula artificiosorum]
MGYIAKFRTPPTPDVYEVWYRYAEGADPALREQLSYAVNDAENASYQQLQQLHQQFYSGGDLTEINQQTGDELAKAMGGFQRMIKEQLSAGSEFESSVSSANDRLVGDNPTVEDLEVSIAAVLSSNQRMQSQLQNMTLRLEETRSQVTKLRENFIESQQKLMTDPLTGVGNRLFFDTMVTNAIDHPERSERYFFLLLVDLDEFKTINDTFGHSTGDNVLRFAASNMERIAEDASIARYGGDEFAVFLNTEQVEEGVDIADAICQFFAKNKLTLNNTGESIGQLTTSIGGALLRAGDDRDSWFERADKLLYNAKKAGRNRTMVERKIS